MKSSVLSLMVFVGVDIYAIENNNPLVDHIYTADPSAHVFDNRVYIYGSHDLDNAKGYKMTDYHVLSSSDLVTWQDHGVALTLDDVPWADNRMWAPDCIYKNGTYYFYFPARDKDNKFRIGVATSKSPAGPFKAEPEAIKGTFSIDPAIFTDDDGQTYMYWGGRAAQGGPFPYVAKLDETMKQFDGDIVELEGPDYYFEGPWVHKLNGIYYLSYSTGKYHADTKDHIIAYATSKSPMGPFTYQGIVNKNVSGITNHHSTVEYNGQWYLFYHNSDLSNGHNARRSIVADYLHFNDDGSIRPVIQTKLGIGHYDASKKIEAENYTKTHSVQKSENIDGGLHVVFAPGDAMEFSNVEFGLNTVQTIELSVSSKSKTGSVYVRGKNGDLLGVIQIPKTGSLDQWTTVSGTIRPTSGVSDIHFTYLDTEDARLHLDYFRFVNRAPK